MRLLLIWNRFSWLEWFVARSDSSLFIFVTHFYFNLCAAYLVHKVAQSWKAFFHSVPRIRPSLEVDFVPVSRCQESISGPPMTSDLLFMWPSASPHADNATLLSVFICRIYRRCCCSIFFILCYLVLVLVFCFFCCGYFCKSPKIGAIVCIKFPRKSVPYLMALQQQFWDTLIWHSPLVINFMRTEKYWKNHIFTSRGKVVNICLTR